MALPVAAETRSRFRGMTTVLGKVIEARRIAFGLPRGVVEATPEWRQASICSTMDSLILSRLSNRSKTF